MVVQSDSHLVLNRLGQVPPSDGAEVAENRLKDPAQGVRNCKKDELLPPIFDAKLDGEEGAFSSNDNIDNGPDQDLGNHVHDFAQGGVD
jgi:hypothetical protein